MSKIDTSADAVERLLYQARYCRTLTDADWEEWRVTLRALAADRDSLAAEVAKMRADMQWFLDRVERGEVRSTRTAARFRATLAGDTP